VEISISFTVDDYSRYTWAILLREKSKSFDLERKLFSRLQIENNLYISRIHNDYDKEFEKY
jgi:hypothetical protein